MKTLVMIAAILCAGLVGADALYWQVAAMANDAWSNLQSVKFAEATLNAVDGDDSSTVSEGYTADGYAPNDPNAEGTKLSAQWMDLGAYGNDSCSFFVELFNASGASLGQNYATTYTELLNSGYISTSGISTSARVLAGGLKGASAPEPTSGLMLLLGGALLGLRRRRS